MAGPPVTKPIAADKGVRLNARVTKHRAKSPAHNASKCGIGNRDTRHIKTL